jgi:hypothetical protein
LGQSESVFEDFPENLRHSPYAEIHRKYSTRQKSLCRKHCPKKIGGIAKNITEMAFLKIKNYLSTKEYKLELL